MQLCGQLGYQVIRDRLGKGECSSNRPRGEHAVADMWQSGIIKTRAAQLRNTKYRIHIHGRKKFPSTHRNSGGRFSPGQVNVSRQRAGARLAPVQHGTDVPSDQLGTLRVAAGGLNKANDRCSQLHHLSSFRKQRLGGKRLHPYENPAVLRFTAVKPLNRA